MIDTFSTAEDALKYLSEKWPTGDEYRIRLANSISEEGNVEVMRRLLGLYYLAETREDGEFSIYHYKRQTHFTDHEGSDYDPICQVVDRKIDVTETMIAELQKFYDSPSYEEDEEFVGCLSEDERKFIRQLANSLTTRMIDAFPSNPSKLWVIQTLSQAIPYVQWEDSVVRDQFSAIVSRIMQIVGIRSSNGYFAYCL